MAEYVEGVGQLGDPVKPVGGVDWTKLALTAQEGFVLSRVDGSASASLLCQLTGLGRDLTLQILKDLRAKGVIVVGNEAPQLAPATETPAPPIITPPRAASPRPPAKPTKPELEPEPEEKLELDPWLEVEFEQEEREGIDLKREIRLKVRQLHGRLDDMTFFDLLGVPLDADLRAVRRAYFKASKTYHPDRYFTKNCGHYGEMLGRIFKQVNSAYEFLQDDAKREQYRRMIGQERENERITRDLEQQVAQVADDLAHARRGEVHDTPPDQPAVQARPVTPPVAPPMAPPVAPPTAPVIIASSQPPVTDQTGPARSYREETPPSVSTSEDDGPIARSTTSPGATYSMVRSSQRRVDKVSLGSAATAVGASKGASARGRSEEDEVDSALADTATAEPAGTADDDDEERAQRRRVDRLRRSRMTASNPVLARKRKALTFYEQGLRQLEEGKSLAAAASLKLAMTYDTTEDKYRELYEAAVDASRATTAEGFFKRAIFEESVGRHETAGKLYQRAADIFPKASYLQRAAESLIWVDDLAKAKEYATQAVQIEPNSVEARLTLSQVYLSSGLKKNARREVDMALKIDPSNADAKELLKKVKRG